MQKNFLHLPFLYVFIIGVLAYSCTKKDLENDTQKENVQLAATKTQYAPFEITAIPFEGCLPGDSVNAQIDGKTVTLYLDRENGQLGVMLPNLPNRMYELTFTANKKNYSIPISVVGLANVQSAETYFNKIQTDLQNSITELTNTISQSQQNGENTGSLSVLLADLNRYDQLLKEGKTELNKMSEKDKQEFALFMAANRSSLSESGNMMSARPTLLRLNEEQNIPSAILGTNQEFFAYSTSSNFNITDYEADIESKKEAFATYQATTVLTIAAVTISLKATIGAPTPWTAFALLASIIAFEHSFTKTLVLSDLLTESAIKPYEMIPDEISGKRSVYGNPMIFSNNTETNKSFSAKYRTIINSDQSVSNKVINDITKIYNTLATKYNSLREKIPAKLRPSYIMKILKESYTTSDRLVHNKYLQISNQTNPKVKFETTKLSDGSFQLKASTEEPTDQNFTFDVSYVNSKFSEVLKKTVSAKVSADSLALYKANVVDNWYFTVFWYGDDGNELDGTWIIKADGTLSLKDNLTGETQTGLWKIKKINSRYYFEISGKVAPQTLTTNEALSYPVKTMKFDLVDGADRGILTISR